MIDAIIAELSGPDRIWWMAGAYFGVVGGERLFYLLRRPGRYNNRDALCSIGLNLMNSMIGILVGLVLAFAVYMWVFHNLRLLSIGHWALAIPLAFVVHELSYYWEDRISHRIGLFWAFHSIHHSSPLFKRINHSTAARGAGRTSSLISGAPCNGRMTAPTRNTPRLVPAE